MKKTAILLRELLSLQQPFPAVEKQRGDRGSQWAVSLKSTRGKATKMANDLRGRRKKEVKRNVVKDKKVGVCSSAFISR
ncbi:MAG: hypothetical protein ACLUGJ_18370 [Blautia wexlerae]